MSYEIDHFVWTVPDLEQGCAQIESLFGAAPVRGGSHPGLGTCNASLSLGHDLYLEIMAPETPRPGSIGERLAKLDAPGLATWVIRGSNLDALAAAAGKDDVEAVALGPVPTKRVTPEGDLLSCELLFLRQHKHGGLVPFAIDWQTT
ncbi:MAG: VOC family protein [Pseudomonadota bacterium]